MKKNCNLMYTTALLLAASLGLQHVAQAAHRVPATKHRAPAPKPKLVQPSHSRTKPPETTLKQQANAAISAGNVAGAITAIQTLKTHYPNATLATTGDKTSEKRVANALTKLFSAATTQDKGTLLATLSGKMAPGNLYATLNKELATQKAGAQEQEAQRQHEEELAAQEAQKEKSASESAIVLDFKQYQELANLFLELPEVIHAALTANPFKGAATNKETVDLKTKELLTQVNKLAAGNPFKAQLANALGAISTASDNAKKDKTNYEKTVENTTQLFHAAALSLICYEVVHMLRELTLQGVQIKPEIATILTTVAKEFKNKKGTLSNILNIPNPVLPFSPKVISDDKVSKLIAQAQADFDSIFDGFNAAVTQAKQKHDTPVSAVDKQPLNTFSGIIETITGKITALEQQPAPAEGGNLEGDVAFSDTGVTIGGTVVTAENLAGAVKNKINAEAMKATKDNADSILQALKKLYGSKDAIPENVTTHLDSLLSDT